MFFRLFDHCVLVEGAKRGAIYNLNSNKVYSINGGATSLLLACRNQPLETSADLSGEEKSSLDFLNKLVSMELGSFYSHEPQFIQTEPLITECGLEFLWLELTSRCNNRCLHCYSESHAACNDDRVSHDKWLSVIREARQAGASGIQLIGGEPLLYRNWRDLVREAVEANYEYIEIFTNATLINQECIDFFKHHQVHIATTIYADNAPVHDLVTQNPGSFDKTLANIKGILAADVPLRVASIIMKANEHEIDNIMRLYAELGLEPNPPDIVRPTGRGEDAGLLPELYRREPIHPPFFTDQESFSKARQMNNCLAGKIAITALGDVIPCIFARNMVCGNILDTPLSEILNSRKLKDCWNTTKNQVEKCKDCEYRYACHDCRPLAQGANPEKQWLAPSPGCSYNPYTGKWEEEKNV